MARGEEATEKDLEKYPCGWGGSVGYAATMLPDGASGFVSSHLSAFVPLKRCKASRTRPERHRLEQEQRPSSAEPSERRDSIA